MTTTTAPTPAARTDASTRRGTRPGSAALVVALCWLIVVFDGYDLIVYGTTIPSLLAEPGWGLTPAGAGTIGSLAFAGMLIGAVAAGTLADRLGRRRTILACIAWFTLFTGLCGVATGPEAFGALRFVAGLGLGGLVPSANALTSEFVSPRLRPWVSTIMMSGVPIGGSIAAVVALPTIPALGWEAMYLVAFGGVLLLALAAVLLPESPAWLRTQGRTEEAAATETVYGLAPGAGVPARRSRFSAVLRKPYGVATALFTGATVATMFAWYGLGTWLPKLMSDDARFDMGHPLSYLLALNLGAVAGSVVTAYVATRIGPLRTAVIAAGAASVGLAFLVTYPSSVSAVYAALVLAGIGTHGTLCLVIAAVASHYPARLRGTSLGVSLGVGRVGAVLAPTVGGFLLAAGLGVGANFLAFAAAAATAALLLSVTWACTRHSVPAESPAQPRLQPDPEPVPATTPA